MISTAKPSDFRQQVEVVSCYVECGGEILLLQRHAKQSHGSKWGLPAGKVLDRESKEEAIVRELEEETGLQMPQTVFTYREVLYVSHEDKDFLYHVFYLHLDAKPRISLNDYEHANHEWLSPEQALSQDLVHDLDACIERHYMQEKLAV